MQLRQALAAAAAGLLAGGANAQETPNTKVDAGLL